MSAFTAHLYREYRDHRVGLWGLLVLVFVSAVAARVVLDKYLFEGLVFLDYFTFGTMVAAAVLFAPDLVRSDEARGTLGFLLRLPRGAHRAFWSKVVFLVAVVGMFGALAWLLCVAIRGRLDPDLWLAVPRDFDPTSWQAISLVVSCSFWMLAVACWLPSTTLSVPATALLLGLVLLPAYLLLQPGELGLLRYFPSLDTWHAVHPLVALLAAWLSFVRGRRAGRGAGSSAWRGLGVAGMGCIALTAWVSAWVENLSVVQPESGLFINNGYLGAGGRYVFLNTKRSRGSNRRDWPSLSVVVDLQERSWRQEGGPGEYFASLDLLERGGHWTISSHPLLIRHGSGHIRLAYLDGRTAAVIKEAPYDLPYQDVIGRARAHYRETTPLRLPDGRRCWVFRNKLEVETEDGGLGKLPWEPYYCAAGATPYALRITGTPGRYLDLTRQGIVRVPPFVDFVDGDRRLRWGPVILPEGLLVGAIVNVKEGLVTWRWFDPETGDARPASALRDGDSPHAVLDDGRLLVSRWARAFQSTGALWALDVGTGERRTIDFDMPGDPDEWWDIGNPGGAPLRSSDGRRLLRFTTYEPRETYFTSHRAGTDALSVPIRAHSIVGCEEAGTILVISADQSELQRVDLDTGAREVVFPPAEAVQ